jgi:hypothetical protein
MVEALRKGITLHQLTHQGFQKVSDDDTAERDEFVQISFLSRSNMLGVMSVDAEGFSLRKSSFAQLGTYTSVSIGLVKAASFPCCNM